MSWGIALTREDQFLFQARQGLEGSFPLVLAVAIRAVMPVLKGQRFLPELGHGGHRDLGEKLLPVMVVELFDDSVPPRFGRRNEPEMDPVTQAQANQGAHAAGMGWAAEKSQFIVRLQILRDPHPQPDRIN